MLDFIVQQDEHFQEQLSLLALELDVI